MQQTEPLPAAESTDRDDSVASPGALDGMTILRYAHVNRYRVSGGVEQYLRQLDRGLLQGHSLTILQMHLVTDDTDETEVENVGRGRIVWVPVTIRQVHSTLLDLPSRIAYVHDRTVRQSRREGQGEFRAALRFLQTLSRHSGGHLRYRTALFSDPLLQLLGTQKVDLLALHWLTYDTDALMGYVSERNIPFVLINHFDNRRLSLPLARKWASRAAGIGTVSSQSIPDQVQNTAENLSDAVDTEFFAPERAKPIHTTERPLVFLPGRIDLGKGHQDAIEAFRILVARNFDVVLSFAGAVDAAPLYQQLRETVKAAGLEDRVLLLGEKSAEEIRDWYARSSVVILPSYSEGLGRVLLEAQAMKKPVVAYDGGGMGEAMLSGKTGFLVKTGDVNALADKIAFLLEDKAERLQFGERGREFVEQRFSVPALVRRHEAFYLRALSGVRQDRARAR
jgi:glycosyltransferase involved in cell wall biosynthesis